MAVSRRAAHIGAAACVFGISLLCHPDGPALGVAAADRGGAPDQSADASDVGSAGPVRPAHTPAAAARHAQSRPVVPKPASSLRRTGRPQAASPAATQGNSPAALGTPVPTAAARVSPAGVAGASRAAAVSTAPERADAVPTASARADAVSTASARADAVSTTSARADAVSTASALADAVSTASALADAFAPAPNAVTGCAHCAAAVAAAKPLQAIGNSVERLLTDAANWLSSLPANPLTNVLEGALWLTRRTLFPASVGVVTAPIEVPLYFTTVGGDQKLGIYAALGGSSTPQLFEFDTGGPGFFAAYASADPAFSPWWGRNVPTTGAPAQEVFDSGLQYTGHAVSTTVSLFSSPGSTTPLVATSNVTVGQMDMISDKNGDVWTPQGSTTPPVDGAFYGDFGASPMYASNGITDLLTQLSFARGMLPGYRIHVDQSTKQAWVQIGLTAADVAQNAGMFFPMVPDPAAPTSATEPFSGTRFYSEQLFNADINIAKLDPTTQQYTTVILDRNVGITPDTGAHTTLHNTDQSPLPSPTDYAGLMDGEKKKLEKDLAFFLTGPDSSGSTAPFFSFITNYTTDDGKVSVQNGNTDAAGPGYYLNTGISLFLKYDVVYSLGNSDGGGVVGLIEPPAPSVAGSAVVASSVGWHPGSILGLFISNGTATHPDAGLLAGNGFSFDAQSCTGTGSCTGGRGGLLIGSGGNGFNGGAGGDAGVFWGAAGDGGNAASGCVANCSGGNGGNSGLFGNGGNGGVGATGAPGGNGGRGGLLGGNGGNGGAGGRGTATVSNGQGGQGGRGGNASPIGLRGDGGKGGAGGVGAPGADAGPVAGGDGAVGGYGGSGGSGSWLIGVGGSGGAGGNGGTGGAGANGAAGAGAETAGGTGSNGGLGKVGGTGGAGGAGGDAGVGHVLLFVKKPGLAGAGGNGGTGGVGGAGGQGGTGGDGSADSRTGGTGAAGGNGGKGGAGGVGGVPGAGRTPIPGNGGNGGGGGAAGVGGDGGKGAVGDLNNPDGGTGGDGGAPGDPGAGGAGGSQGAGCGCARDGVGGTTGASATSGGNGGAGGRGADGTSAVNGGTGGTGGSGGPVGRGGRGGDGGNGANGGDGGTGGSGGTLAGTGGAGGAGGITSNQGGEGGKGGQGGDASATLGAGGTGGAGGNGVLLDSNGGRGGDGGNGGSLGIGGAGGQGGKAGQGGTDGKNGKPGSP